MTQQVETPSEQSWRGISQAVSPKRMTSQGRRRLGSNVLRTTFSLFVIGALAGAGAYLWNGFETPAKTLAPVVKAEPLREVIVLTDGVLTREWALPRLALPEGVTLVAVDLDAAKVALEREAQVRAAVVSRDFPDTLVVTLEERVPVARVMASPASGEVPGLLLLAPDGVVFRGHNYDPAMLGTLPWLDGIRLTRRADDGFDPVGGVDLVADLILAVRQEAPHFARDFQVVSLSDLPRLVVRTPEVRQVVFEAGNYRRQLARLDYILEFHRRQAGAPALERLDLSMEAQVIVKYAGRLPVSWNDSSPNRNLANLPLPNRGLQR